MGHGSGFGRGFGQVVSVLALNFDDPSLSPTKDDNLAVKWFLKRTKKQKSWELPILIKSATKLLVRLMVNQMASS